MRNCPKRTREKNAFLEKLGWKEAQREFLIQDASFKYYERVWDESSGELRRALLMDAPPKREAIMPFIKIAQFLKEKGLSSPAIYGHDEEKGFILLEDFGDETFTKALLFGHDKKELYTKAIDVLVHLYKNVSAEELSALTLSKYTQEKALEEVLFFFEWYIPGVLGKPISESKKQEFVNIFKDLYREIADFPSSLALRDYHVENLMILPAEKEKKESISWCGVLDFQGAVEAPLVYDLVSLLEDPRQDREENLAQYLISYYKKSFPVCPWESEEHFSKAYVFWSIQRNLRILSIFTRLAFRDKKERYLSFIPRTWQSLEKDLSHPFLRPLYLYLKEILPKNKRTIPSPFWPKQAIVLAAGLGKRMLPLTQQTPKPLLSFKEDTLLGYVLDKVAILSPSNVIINSHHLADQVREYVKQKAISLPFSITLSHESILLETGGAVVNILPYLDKEAPFYMVASDLIWTNLVESPLLQLARAFDPDRMDALLVVTPKVSQGDFQIYGYTGPGDFFLESDQKLRFRGQEKEAPYVFPSLQIVHPRLFEKESVRSFSVIDIYKKAQENGRLFGLLIEEGTWFHVGTPEAYELLQHNFSESLLE